jgi:hypothetical protein
MNAMPKKSARKPVKKQVKRKAAKPVRRKAASKTLRKVEKPIGKVTHFYAGIKVAVVKFSKDVKKGAQVRFEGATTKFLQKLESMQHEHKALSKAPKGKLIGVKVRSRVRAGDKIYAN